MRLPIQRIDTYTHPVSGTAAHDVRRAVEDEILERVPALENDALFEVSAEPRGTYTGITVFVQSNNLEATTNAARAIQDELESKGVLTLINVRSWS